MKKDNLQILIEDLKEMNTNMQLPRYRQASRQRLLTLETKRASCRPRILANVPVLQAFSVSKQALSLALAVIMVGVVFLSFFLLSPQAPDNSAEKFIATTTEKISATLHNSIVLNGVSCADQRTCSPVITARSTSATSSVATAAVETKVGPPNSPASLPRPQTTQAAAVSPASDHGNSSNDKKAKAAAKQQAQATKAAAKSNHP